MRFSWCHARGTSWTNAASLSQHRWGSIARISGGCAPKAVSSVVDHLGDNHPLPSLSLSQSRFGASSQDSSAVPPSFVLGLQPSSGFHLSCPSEMEVGRWWPSLPSAGGVQIPPLHLQDIQKEFQRSLIASHSIRGRLFL